MQKIRVFHTVIELQNQLDEVRKEGAKIGFVPTMGALHNGHISLVETAKQNADYTVVSIFVNPTQFNNPEDLEKYPRTVEDDIALLEENGVDAVFVPSVSEVYPESYAATEIDLGSLATVMEGEFRPGHFQGVVEVVKRFFDIVQPAIACFGKKDFQQLAIIKYMVEYFHLPVEIISCTTKREPSGLAMSSRNMRLSEGEKEASTVLFKTLQFVEDEWVNYSPNELKKKCIEHINETDLSVEYFEIVDPKSLQPLNQHWGEKAVCCVAAFCGDVRLIDNIEVDTLSKL